MAKSKQKIEARRLRKLGKSIKEIASLLNVSPGSVSSWCRDILLTKKQIINLGKRITDPFYGEKLSYLLKKKKELSEKIDNLKTEGINEVGSLTKREIFLIGIALYWGEGFKKDHQVGFATSDTYMAKFFINWLNTCFGIKAKDLILRVTANISYKKNIKELERFWAKQLSIPINNFSKPFFQHTIWKKIYEDKSKYHGVIRIKVRRSVDLLRKIYGYIEGISYSIINND